MSIDFTCRNCSTILRVPDEHLGKQARCPKCQLLCEVRPDSEVQFLDSGAPQGIQYPDPVQPTKSEYAKPDYANEAQPANKVDYSDASAQNPYHSASTANDQKYVAGGQRPNYSVAHRGGLVLAMGILSVFCNFAFVPGILAWVFGTDLKQMESGVMDNEGRGMTQAGMYIGIVMTCLPLVLFALYFVFIIFMIFISIAAG